MSSNRNTPNQTEASVIIPRLQSNKKTKSMFYKCLPRSRKTPKKARVPPSQGTRNASAWKRLSARVVKRHKHRTRHICTDTKQHFQPVEHGNNYSQHEASLTDYTEATSREEQSNMEELRRLNNHIQDHYLLCNNHSHPDPGTSLTIFTEPTVRRDESNTKYNTSDNGALTLINIDVSNTRQISLKATQDSTATIHPTAISKQLNYTNYRKELLSCHNEGMVANEMRESPSNESDNDTYPVTEIRFIDESAICDRPETKKLNQHTASREALSLVDSTESGLNVDNIIHENCGIEANSLITIAPTSNPNLSNCLREDSFTVSIEATTQEDELTTKFKMYDEKQKCSTPTEHYTSDMDYSFEIALDALSLAQSDLNEEDSLEDSCVTDENLLGNIASIFSFDQIFDALTVFNNGPRTSSDVTSVGISEHWYSVIVDEYLDTDAKLSMALTSNRKKGLVQKRRTLLHRRRRAHTVMSLLVFTFSLTCAYILLEQWMTWNSHTTLHVSERLERAHDVYQLEKASTILTLDGNHTCPLPPWFIDKDA